MAAKVKVTRGTLCKSSQGGLGAPITFCLMGAERSQSRAGGSVDLQQWSREARQADVDITGLACSLFFI